MDEKKIFIANLSKGLLGPGHANLLGTMLVSGFSNAAARRGQANATARIPFYLHVDECENFVTDAFGDIVSEARKWKLSLVLAHQFLQQLPSNLRAGVLANVGSIVAFQLGGDDAEVIAREVGLKTDNADLLAQLSRGEVWAKHASYGGPYHPQLLEPIETHAKGREAALKQNRLRNTFLRKRVMQKVDRFLAPPRPERFDPEAPDPWPLSLRVFRSALKRALTDNGQMIARPNGSKILAVDHKHVCEEFEEVHLAHGQTAEERRAERDKAFKRAAQQAQQRRLILAFESDGTQWVALGNCR
jgi:hypothetical protein